MLDAGRVVERGTHDELLAAGGRYADLWWRRDADRTRRDVDRPARPRSADGRHAAPSEPPNEGSDTVTTDLARWQFAMTSIYHFLFVPVTIGLAFLVALLQTALVPQRGPRLPAADPVLRHPAADQRGDGRGHRTRPGVRVRHELVGLLTLGGQRLRWPAGHGGPAGLLLGVDVPRPVDLRVGPAVQDGSTWPASGWWRRPPCCRPPSSWRPTPGCSTRSAT